MPELLCALGHNKIHVPEAVEFEVINTPNRHRQFKRAQEMWPRFPPRFLELIRDKPTPELRQCCRSVFGVDFDTMYAEPKDRGEHMAILHGVLRARAGHEVVLVCDDEAGIAMIKRQARILALEQARGVCKPGGSISHADTVRLLYWAIERGGFKRSRKLFQKKYEAMAGLDQALPRSAKEAGLTKSPPWPRDMT